MRNSCQYKLAGTKTFRRSSSKILGKWGTNLQNLEKSVREPYQPDGFSPDKAAKCLYWLETGDLTIFTEEELATIKVFLQTDQSGAEALIVAYDSEARDFRKLFENKIKPHVYVALKLFKDIWRDKMKEKGGLIEDLDIDAIASLPIDKLKGNPYWRELDLLIKDSDNWSLQERYYYLAKQTCHSANYGIEAQTFRMNILEKSGGKIVISFEDAKRFLTIYRSLFPEIPESNERIKRQVEETGIIYNMFGFPYYITDYDTSSKMKEYYAWPRQSTVGEITRIAISREQEFIESEKRKWDILADTHDSSLTQCFLVDVKECIAKKQECFNIEMTSPIDGVKFRMRSETNVGFNWSPFKKGRTPDLDKNKLGLREITW